MNTAFRFAAIFTVLCLPAFGTAQGVINLQTYKLQPDDLIEISVPNHLDLKYSGPVPPGGKISLPEIGIITLVGKTSAQLENELLTKISVFRNNVAVNVILLEARSKSVQIVGTALKGQGKFTMVPGWRLFDLIAAAGGIMTKPERVSAKLVRGAKLIPLNYVAASNRPDSEDNTPLQPGDMVLLEEIELQHAYVSITGEVAKRSVVELDADLDLYKLVLLGQPTEFASLSKAHILRGTEEIPINLDSVASAKPDKKILDFKLKNGDTLYIPRNETKFSVLGVVGKPGTYPLPENKTVMVLDAYVLAGGASQGADPSRAGLLRTDGKKSSIIHLNLDKIQKKGNTEQNIALKDGDILFVPPRGSSGFRIEELVTPLYLLRLFGL
jgi:protein involved in polysaccharide export with SLBB domain